MGDKKPASKQTKEVLQSVMDQIHKRIDKLESQKGAFDERIEEAWECYAIMERVVKGFD